MNLKRKILVVLLLACVFMEVHAQAVETYRVRKSDTIESIAVRLGMTVDELWEFNPQQKGRELVPHDILIVPSKRERKARAKQRELAAQMQVVDPTPAPVEFTIHVVQPKETVYGISRQWGITQDMLREYNPELNTSVLKIGMELKIPVVKPGDQVVDPLAAPSASSRPDPVLPVGETPVPQGEQTTAVWEGPVIPAADTILHARAEQLDVKRILHVDVMLPFFLDEADSLVDQPAARRLEKSRVAMGFYMGVRMALDSLAGQGLMADVRVFDTRRSIAAVDSLMAANDFSQTDIVIGPLYAEIAQRVADNLKGSKAIVVSPFSLKHDVTDAPNIMQASTPQTDLQDAVLRYMADMLPAPQHLIVVASSTQHGVQIEKIRRALATKTDAAGIQVLDTDLGENALRLSRSIVQAGALSIVTPSLDASTTTEILRAVELSNRVDDVYVYAFDADARAKKIMEETNERLASRLHFIYAERLFENEGKASYREFVRAFRRQFRERPGAYSLPGFDITYDLLSRLAVEEDNETALTERPSEQVAHRFRFIKYMGGGYVNTDVFILMYDLDHGTVLLY